jgi:hypothetical protein
MLLLWQEAGLPSGPKRRMNGASAVSIDGLFFGWTPHTLFDNCETVKHETPSLYRCTASITNVDSAFSFLS